MLDCNADSLLIVSSLYMSQIEPKATDFIPEMISTIQTIMDNGHAYALDDGDVYFDVMSSPGYGRLSGRSQVRLSELF